MATEILALDEITESQATKYITHNTALRQIEGRLVRVLSKSTAAQPGSPANGDTYILPSGKTGAQWAGYTTNNIAHYYGGAWSQATPKEGYRLHVNDEDLHYKYDGSQWVFDDAGFPESIGSTEEIIIQTGKKYLTFGDITVTGTLTINGELQII